MAFTIYDLLAQWQTAGIFDILLPFLLIFAVIFGILTSTNAISANRGVSLIIALVVSLLAIRLPFVSIFFSELFPRLGVGIAILLTIVILAGLFFYKESLKGWLVGLSVTGAVLAIIIVLMSFNEFDWFGSFFWQEYWGLIIGVVLIAIVVVAVFVTSGDKPQPKEISLPLPKFR